MKFGLHYNNLHLPEELSKIIEKNFWMCENIGPEMLFALREPIRFEAMTWIMLWQGKCSADINLVHHDIVGPAFVMIKSSQIMQPASFSKDFLASVMVMSKEFTDNLFMLFNNSSLYNLSAQHSVVPIPDEITADCKKLFGECTEILADKSNPYLGQALLFTIISFIYKSGYKCFEPYQNEYISQQGRISNRFMTLVQENFKQERFLEFYADRLEITPKHLSRTVKNQTGFTAVEWIERYVILEAKVLLKSSNLNIQQISDELNFPTQSFFGKYFKKVTGMSPTEFRNSDSL